MNNARQAMHLHVATLNRAPRPYLDRNYKLVLKTLGIEKAANVFYKNAIGFYRPTKIG